MNIKNSKTSNLENEIEKLKNQIKNLELENQYYLSLLETSKKAIIEHKIDGTIIKWNKVSEPTLGISKDDAIGKNIYKILSSEIQNEIDKLIKNNQKNKQNLNKTIEINNYKRYDKKITLTISLFLKRDYENEISSVLLIVNEIIKENNNSFENDLYINRYVFESTICAMCFTDLDGNIIYVNKSALKLFRYKNESEMLGKHISNLMFSRNQAKDILEALDKKRFYQGEGYGFCEDEYTPYVKITANYIPSKDEIPLYIMLSVIDITIEKESETFISEKEKLFQTVFNMSVDPFTLSRINDGKFFNINNSFLEFTGYSKDEIIGKTVSDIDLWVSDRTEIVKEIKEKGYTSNKEVIGRKKDGTLFTILYSGRIIDYKDEKILLSNVRDITNLKEINNELQASEEKYRNLAEGSPYMIVIHQNQFVKYINKAGLKLLGLTSYDEIIGKPVLNFVSPSERNMSEERIKKRLSDEKELTTPLYEQKIIRKDGKEIDIEVSGTLCKYENKKAIQIIARDITELKMLIENLETSKNEAEKANKAKDEFLSVMSHELRTPLNGILGLTQILLLNEDFDDAHTKMLKSIKDSGQHLLSILQDILDITAIESGKLKINNEIFSFEELFESLIQTFKMKTEKKALDFICQYVPDIKIKSDKTKIKQILFNLFMNAVKYTDEGFVKCEFEINNRDFEIKIIDSGVGIPEEKIDMIFKAFTQLESALTRKHGGVGLGLYLCKRLSDAIEAELKVESENQKGSTFILKLPNKIVDNEIDFSNELNNKISNNETKNIFILDIENTNTVYLENIINKYNLNINIIKSNNEKESLELLNKNSEKINLIFIDFKAMKMNIEEYLSNVKNNEKIRNIPIIAIIKYLNENEMKEYSEKGISEFINKPFIISNILDLIKKGI